MHYDVAIIGAGMSGLAAGIRLAYFDKNVCIFDRHDMFGGLNSFYTLDGRQFDVGLHALTNYAPATERSAPLNKLLRQLRMNREELDLCEQDYSEVRFPGRRLRFSNGLGLMEDDVAETFPAQIDRFRRFLADVRAYDDTRLDAPSRSGRGVLAEYFTDQTLIDMILCGPLFYGSPVEYDIDFTHFVTLFKSIFCEGLARPRGGVRVIIRALVKKFRASGGHLRMGCGVEKLETDGERVTALRLDNGETVTADAVISSAGHLETLRLCSPEHEGNRFPPLPLGEGWGEVTCVKAGRISFVESISIVNATPKSFGLDSAIIFFNDGETFTYARPDELVDVRSGVICCPNNFHGHEGMEEGVIRLTSLANYDRWSELDEERYGSAKRECYQRIADRVVRFIPEFRHRLVYTDMFTPRTIKKYTGHIGGAVYGAPHKVRDGRTRYKNLFLCGTDQGFLGVIGAMLSGVLIANMRVLSPD